MLKRLLAWGTVLLIAALLAVPAFAQDISAEAGASPFTVDHCPALEADPAVWEMVVSMFPELEETCA